MPERLTIKSAGYIDGEYRVILSNGAELGLVKHIEIEKDIDSFGEVRLVCNIDEIKRKRENTEKLNKNIDITLRSSLTTFVNPVSEEAKNFIQDRNNAAFYELKGSLEKIIKNQHRQNLAVLAKTIAECDENKNSGVCWEDLLKEFVEKYKITNID